MKRVLAILLAAAILFSLAACGKRNNSPAKPADRSTIAEAHDNAASGSGSGAAASGVPEQSKTSADKYTWYVKNYVGKNCAALGYTSISGQRLDTYGDGFLKLIFVCSGGAYINVDSDDALKEYTVIGQSLAPNTELKYIFEKGSDGNEYDHLVAHQNHEQIVLNVKKVGASDAPLTLTAIDPSPDKYTWYIADYVGRNLANCGYISMSGRLMDTYGPAYVELAIVTEDGSYVDPSNAEQLQCYVVTGQSVAPNTALALTFDTDSNGVEYDNVVETQNIEQIEVYVARIPDAGTSAFVPAVDASQTSAPARAAEAAGLRPEFQQAMDSYEAFYTEYCEFLKKYNENASDLKLLAQYADMLAQAQEMEKAFEAWDTDELSQEELQYYLDVNDRVIKMLADITA